MSAGARSGSRVIRVADLDPTWDVPHAREPGFLRWLISYVGGPPGFINNNPETGLLSERIVEGLMWLPVGNRQFGVHVHTVTEIYVILRGRVRSIEPGREPEVAGPLDCLYIPAGSPHAVRTVGDEDVLLLWLHDDLESAGASQYFDDPSLTRQPDAPAVSLITWDSLEPWWGSPRAKEGGHIRWHGSWVGGVEGHLHFNRGTGVTSERLALGMTVILPGNAQVLHWHPTTEHYVVARGQASLLGQSNEALLGACDYVSFPADTPHGVRAVGNETLYLIWLLEEPERDDAVTYGSDGADIGGRGQIVESEPAGQESKLATRRKDK